MSASKIWVGTVKGKKGFQKGSAMGLTHGKSKTKTFRIWLEMRRRCRDPKTRSYKRYGGRGIVVCERWMLFEHFLSDMGDVPEGLQLDRINTHGNYEPGNCRWVTPQTQQNNRTNNVRVTIGERTQTIAEWARESGVRPRTAAQRIRAGWPPELAVTRSPDRGRQWQSS